MRAATRQLFRRLARVVQQNLPASRSFAPDKRENAIVLLRISLGGAFEMELAGHYSEFDFTAGVGQQAHIEVREGERAHLLGCRVGLLVPLEDGTISLPQCGTDERR